MPFFGSFRQIWKDLLAANNLFFSYTLMSKLFFSHTLWSKLFFLANFVIKLFFYEKTIPPPPPLVLNGRPLSKRTSGTEVFLHDFFWDNILKNYMTPRVSTGTESM